MTGNSEVVKALQAAAAAEARLNLQYRLDSRSLKFMGVKKVAKKAKKFGDDAHSFLKQVTDRVLFLGGNPSYIAAVVTEAPTFTAVIENELALELGIVQPYEQAVQLAAKALDDTTRNLFEHLLKWHQKHIAWLERQVRLMAGFAQDTGESRYIAEKL